MDLITQDKVLPVNPTSADTSNWYRLGDAVEKHGRHMKRQAVAAEYNSGRNMAAWCRELGTSEGTMREILTEARNLELVGDAPFVTTKVSAALPTQAAAREYAKAEPEIREVIKEIIKEDPEAEIKVAEIKRLRAELAATQQANEEYCSEALFGRSLIAENESLKSQLDAVTNNDSTQLAEARKTLDLFGQDILSLARQIDAMSNSTFTHNDQSYLDQIESHLATLAIAFQRRREAFCVQPDDCATIDCTAA